MVKIPCGSVWYDSLVYQEFGFDSLVAYRSSTTYHAGVGAADQGLQQRDC
jgi:hypothetical protein